MASEIHVRILRIFLSSPGDVQAERGIARELIKDVLPYAPLIRGRVTFDVVSWDDPHASPGLSAHLTPQEAINQRLPKPSECDIVIVVLWSQLGTPLPSEITRDDGSTYQSGTEWEFEDALKAAAENDRPTILLYRRSEEPTIGLDDTRLHEKLEQYRKVKEFFTKLKGSGGSLTRTVTNYPTANDFRELLRQNLESAVGGILGDDFSRELGVTKAAVENMFAILKEQNVEPDQLDTKLRQIAERQIELTKQLHAQSKSNDVPEITKLREEAAVAIEDGDYDRAAELLAEAVGIDRRAIDDHQDILDRRKLSAAATFGQQGGLERTRLNYRKAAEHFAEAARLVASSDSDSYLKYLGKQASILVEHGYQFGDNSALLEAINIYSEILERRPRERAPLEWASTLADFGIALRTLGWRESNTLRLEQAVVAFRGALEEHNREHMPLQWAGIQNNLGIALSVLGDRQNDKIRLEQAVAAFYAALSECTRDRAPLQWARTQNNLGIALKNLGSRESGTKRFEQAILAYNAALEEKNREREPLDWARTQNALGNVLWIVGERESGIVKLKRALNAFQNALEERRRDRVPLEWAMTQMNVGIVLKSLGEREGEKKRLEQAVTTFEAALEEITRDRVPLEWARTQNFLGIALKVLGRRENSISRFERSIEAFQNALEERTRDRVPLQWATTKENIGLACMAIAEKTGDEITLLDGIDSIKAGLEVFKTSQSTHDLKRARRHLADAKAMLVSLRG